MITIAFSIIIIALVPLTINMTAEDITPDIRDQTIIRCKKEPKWCKEQYSFLMLQERFEKEEAKRNP
jgi:hypothetical protein